MQVMEAWRVHSYNYKLTEWRYASYGGLEGT